VLALLSTAHVYDILYADMLLGKVPAFDAAVERKSAPLRDDSRCYAFAFAEAQDAAQKRAAPLRCR